MWISEIVLFLLLLLIFFVMWEDIDNNLIASLKRCGLEDDLYTN